MRDMVFCLIVAAARYTFVSTTTCKEDTDKVLEFLYHPSMGDNSDIYYMYQMG